MTKDLKNNETHRHKSEEPIKKTETISDYKPDQYLNWFEKALAFVEKYGFRKILKTLFVIAFVSYFLYVAFNPEVIFNKITEYRTEQHAKAIETRIKVDPQVRLLLKELLMKVSASNAFVLEMHDGSANGTNLPFVFTDMRYEERADSTANIDEDFQTLTMSRFPIFNVIFTDGIWLGTTDEMKILDDKLAARFSTNGITTCGFTILYGSAVEIGFLGIGYNENSKKPEDNYIKNQLRIYAQKISVLLDGSNAGIK